jgi:hypothetical protein
MGTACNWSYKEEYEKVPTSSQNWRSDTLILDEANWIQISGYVRSITEHKVFRLLQKCISKDINL